MARKLALALAVIAALVAVLVVVRQRDERAARVTRLAAHLVTFDDRKVEGVDVWVPSATWRFVRVPSGWRIVSPVADVADSRKVEALLGAARRAPIVKTIADPEPLTSYGLAAPRARLSLVGVEAPAIELGVVAPTGDGVFARIANRHEVFLLGLPDAAPLAQLDPVAFRERAIVDVAQSEIMGITLSRQPLQLERVADRWWITSPRRLPASRVKIETFLGALFAAQVGSWDDAGSPADPRFELGDGAAQTVTLRTADDAQTITLGAEAGDGRRFVTSQGRKSILVATVAQAAIGPFDVANLRETRLTNVNRYDVTRLDYTSGGERLSAARKDQATWVTAAGDTIPAERVYALLVALLEAETIGVMDGRLETPPSATLTFEIGAERTKGTLTFAGDRAVWDVLPGVVFRLAAPPPSVPRWSEG